MSKSLETLAAEYEAAQSEYLTRSDRYEAARARNAAASSIAEVTRAVSDVTTAKSLADMAEARMRTAQAAFADAQTAAELVDIRERAATGDVTIGEMTILDNANRADRAADPELAEYDRRLAEYQRRRNSNLSTEGFEDVRDAEAAAKAAPLPDWLQRVVDAER